MGVGIREMYDKQGQRVSPLLFQWDGRRWGVFAEVKASATP
jgi:hypothetical protein